MGRRAFHPDCETPATSGTMEQNRRKFMDHPIPYNNVLSSDTLLHNLFRESPVGMAILTADDGIFVDINDAFADLLGVTRDQILGRPFSTGGLHIQIERTAILEIIRLGLRISDVPFSMSRADGSSLTCIASVQYEQIDGANYFLLIIQDITEHELAQLSLQQVETRFQLFFSGFPLPLLVIDEETFRILDVNPAACRLYGYTRDEFLALSLIDLIPSARAGDKSASRVRKQPGAGHSVITRQVLKDNSIIEANITSYSFLLEGRRANLSIVQDITEERRMQATLEAGEERVRIIADLTADAIWDHDLVTDEVTWSVGLSTLFGHIPHDKGNIQWWHDQVHPDDRPAIDEAVRVAMETGQNYWSGEYRFRRADGSYAHVLDNGYIVRDDEGRPVRFMGSMVDITEQLQVTEFAARAALEERQRLAFTLQDSVTQSLYSISLLAEAAKRQVESGHPAIPMEHISRLKDLSMQTLRQMRLMVYELRPGVLEQEGLAGALRHRLEAVEHRAGITGRLIDDTRLPIPAAMQNDLFWIAQEALNNSLRHASATSVSVRMVNKGHHLVMEIADNGRGFESDPRDKSGGLATIRRRVYDLNGTLELINPPGGGVTLVIRVPL